MANIIEKSRTQRRGELSKNIAIGGKVCTNTANECDGSLLDSKPCCKDYGDTRGRDSGSWGVWKIWLQPTNEVNYRHRWLQSMGGKEANRKTGGCYRGNPQRFSLANGYAASSFDYLTPFHYVYSVLEDIFSQLVVVYLLSTFRFCKDYITKNHRSKERACRLRAVRPLNIMEAT